MSGPGRAGKAVTVSEFLARTLLRDELGASRGVIGGGEMQPSLPVGAGSATHLSSQSSQILVLEGTRHPFHLEPA